MPRCRNKVKPLRTSSGKFSCTVDLTLSSDLSQFPPNEHHHLLPKFHPELNPLEYLWGWSKRYFRERSNGKFGFGKSLVPISLDVCPLVTIRRFFCHSEHYISVYSLGATGLAAEYAVKKYRSHRGVSQQDLDVAEEERMAKATTLLWCS
jgi:hypothetical protein